MSRSVHVSNPNKHQGSTIHKSRGGGGATDRPTSHAAATDSPPTPTLDARRRFDGRRSRVYFFSRPARVSRSRSRRRERRARTPVGRTDRILARGGGGRGRSRSRAGTNRRRGGRRDARVRTEARVGGEEKTSARGRGDARSEDARAAARARARARDGSEALTSFEFV